MALITSLRQAVRMDTPNALAWLVSQERAVVEVNRPDNWDQVSKTFLIFKALPLRCVSTAFAVCSPLPVPCPSTAFVAKTVPLRCAPTAFAVRSHCLRLRASTAVVAEAVPFLAAAPQTSLHVAVTEGNKAAAHILIEHGAVCTQRCTACRLQVIGAIAIDGSLYLLHRL